MRPPDPPKPSIFGYLPLLSAPTATNPYYPRLQPPERGLPTYLPHILVLSIIVDASKGVPNKKYAQFTVFQFPGHLRYGNNCEGKPCPLHIPSDASYMRRS